MVKTDIQTVVCYTFIVLVKKGILTVVCFIPSYSVGKEGYPNSRLFYTFIVLVKKDIRTVVCFIPSWCW